jgi:(4-(4-[2-(gamma-L-glutamylamino)ethyl]phenoxymethyl)furan-2-yl)methanamine synthase
MSGMVHMSRIVGWDIGAANIKAVWLEQGKSLPGNSRSASQAFEIWRGKGGLRDILHSVFEEISRGAIPDAAAVTMTAELSDAFETKREGVLYVLQSLKTCLGGIPIYVFSLSGKFLRVEEALIRPLEFAASNWLATALWISRRSPNCLVIDVGSTTTDILPVVEGEICVQGRTDLERLASGELVYTGLLRTNLAAIVQSVPVRGKLCRVSSEFFAISGDVHLILGQLDLRDYTCTTPDGRAPSVDSARRRLARLVCGDMEMLLAAEVDEIACYIRARQILQIRAGIEQVISRLPSLRARPAVVLGSGAFLGAEAASSVGLEIEQTADLSGIQMAAVAPSLAVARLLSEYLGRGTR